MDDNIIYFCTYQIAKNKSILFDNYLKSSGFQIDIKCYRSSPIIDTFEVKFFANDKKFREFKEYITKFWS